MSRRPSITSASAARTLSAIFQPLGSAARSAARDGSIERSSTGRFIAREPAASRRSAARERAGEDRVVDARRDRGADRRRRARELLDRAGQGGDADRVGRGAGRVAVVVVGADAGVGQRLGLGLGCGLDRRRERGVAERRVDDHEHVDRADRRDVAGKAPGGRERLADPDRRMRARRAVARCVWAAVTSAAVSIPMTASG